MKYLIFISILFIASQLFASPNEILCINKHFVGKYREIRFVKENGNLYKTTLTTRPEKTEMHEALSSARLYILRRKVMNINGLDLVVEFDKVTKANPTKPARVQLTKYKMNAKNWLCKGYF